MILDTGQVIIDLAISWKSPIAQLKDAIKKGVPLDQIGIKSPTEVDIIPLLQRLAHSSPETSASVKQSLLGQTAGGTKSSAHAFLRASDERRTEIYGDRAYFVLFKKDPYDVGTPSSDWSKTWIAGQGHHDRVIVPTDKKDPAYGFGGVPVKMLSQGTFIIFAKPSIKLDGAKIGTLNWHVDNKYDCDFSIDAALSAENLIKLLPPSKTKTTLNPCGRPLIA